MKNTIDWADPETFKPPQEVFNKYQNETTCVHNTLVREDPKEGFLSALAKYHDTVVDTVCIDGKCVDEYIGTYLFESVIKSSGKIGLCTVLE